MTEEKKKKKEEAKNADSDKKEIVIKETEEDIVLGAGFASDPEDFKDEIKREAEKNGFFSKYVMPLFFVLVVAAASAFATWYYAKPERSIDAEVKAEDKIQTPPTIQQPEKPATPTTPATPAPAPTEKKEISYTVQEGDTMSGVANKYDMSSSELATYNGLSDVNSLTIGQTLKIPVK